SIPTHTRPFTGTDSTGFVNNITGFRRYIREASSGTTFWYGMPWLGELYPDSVGVSQFTAQGNLLAGSGNSYFQRARDSDVFTQNDKYRSNQLRGNTAVQRTAEQGCVTFMNNGTSSAHFNHHFAGANAPLVGSGLELQSNYNFPLPSQIYSNRPFTVNTSGNTPLEFSLAPYSTNRFTASILKEYYDYSGWTASGLVLLENPAATKGAYVIVSGLAPTTSLGSAFIAKYSVIAMLQSYFEVGATSMTHRVKQTPRVEIVAPTEITELVNPTRVTLKWESHWVRWDGAKYTASTPTTFSETESEIEYSMMISKDNGKTWKHLALSAGVLSTTATDATPGVKPTDASLLIADVGPGQESQDLDTPSASYPEAAYLLRIEAYRQGQALHYSHHVQRFFIDR
ncbi:MAG: hypothetical protein KDC87_19195, partial [Planctomycetes bacterium]|nr:hypothetical protein [Planctomycetota bacterium]